MYEFIPKEELQSVLDISNFPESDRAEIAYQQFVYGHQEAMYIEKNGALIGVVSIGDLERYYAGGLNKLEINNRFSSADKIDEEKAAVFFRRFKTFYEFPVVNDYGQLEGVLKREIRYDIRQDQIASLVVSKYLKEKWHRKELNRFLTNTKARVILYYAEEAVILRELAGKRKAGVGEESEEIYWKGLSKRQWGEFLGEPDIVTSLKKEFGNFHTKLVKGVSEVVDMEGAFYHCAYGSRVTLGNPKNPERRIIFYGPCTFAGAYCKDGQTIESYMQRILNKHTKVPIQVINRGLFNMTNFFSRMMTDELSERDIAVIYVERGWLTEEISEKCVYVGSLTDAFLHVEDLENNMLDSPEHCNYKVNECLAEQIYHDLEVHKLMDNPESFDGLSAKAECIQDYYIGSETMSEVLCYMERNNLLMKEEADRRGAMTLLADPFTDYHRRAVENALGKVDKLYLFISEDSNLSFTLEQRLQMTKEALQDLGDKVVVVPAGKYLYTKKISRGIRKQRFCDNEMEYDCDVFGEIFGRFMGIGYRFIVSELHNPVERKYMDTCMNILPEFGVKVEEL